jgi:hypothetical protein
MQPQGEETLALAWFKISIHLVFPTKAGTANHAPQHLRRKMILCIEAPKLREVC